jgi:hypothetical protein
LFKKVDLKSHYFKISRLTLSEWKDKTMIIKTKSGRTYDTERDLVAAERHILQKLFIWESMASSIEEFRQKKKDALFKGWNNSGPVGESEALRTIITDLEEKVILRLSGEMKSSSSPSFKEGRE